MSYQIKMWSWPDLGNHVIAIVSGPIEANGFKEIFARLAEAAQPLPDCKILIDLEDASYTLKPTDISRLVDGFTPELWPQFVRMAIVPVPTASDHDQLLTLSTYLSKLGLNVAVLYDTKSAIDWLAETTIVQ